MPKIDVTYATHVQQRLAVALDVYKDISTEELPGGWRRSFDNSSMQGNQGGLFAAVYERQVSDNPEYMIAFRGFDGLKDIDDIARIKLGGLPGQVFNALAFSRTMADAHGVPMAEIEYVGHSLGGYLARAVGVIAQSDNIQAFNSPGLYRKDLEPLSELRRSVNAQAPDVTAAEIEQRTQNLDSESDFAALFGPLRGQTTTVPTESKHHSLSTLWNAMSELVNGNTPAAPAAPTAAVAMATPRPTGYRNAMAFG